MINRASRRWLAAVTGGLALIVGLAPIEAAEAAPAPAGSEKPAAEVRSGGTVDGTDDGSCIPLGAKKSRGSLAVEHLGDNLDRVARRIGRTGASLRHELLTDKTLWVDGCSRPYYVEPTHPDLGKGDPGEAATTSALFPYSETFRLHSRPDSLRTIYLDFDGYYVEGSAWAQSYNSGNAWTAPAYDTDGNAATFSDSERNTIQSIWQRVSEDYAPFDVDVTTEDPGFDAIDRSSSSDTRYGTRALITKDTVVGGTCGCGGIAYVGVFDSTQAARYQPAFVFTAGVGTGAKNLAEATSHEVGHNLGLSHDGTTTGCGTGGTSACGYYQGVSGGVWAPIMGVGYYNPLVQWSKGEYANANNAENDFSVVASNGALAMTDDHGDTTATSTVLGSTLPVGVTGQIDTAADVDMFRFTSAGGVTTFSVSPAPVSPDLDAKVTVYDSTGAVVGSADPAVARTSGDIASGLSATYTSGALAAGTYYVGVEGVGSGVVTGSGYSDYGTIGRYSLAISTTAGPAVATSSLADASTGVPYDAVLQAAGGTGTYSWSLSGGALPAGLTLGSDGSITGTPTAAANATFTVTVTDGGSLSATRSLTINAGLTITSKNLPEASTATAYSTTLAVAGGTAPYTWSLASGSVPSGMSLSSAGVISGASASAATTAFTVRVTDAASRTTTRVLTITVASALSASSLSNSSLVIGTSASLNLAATGGRPGYIWSLVSGSFIPGLRLNDVGTITGTPLTKGTSTATVKATDRSGRTSTTTVTLTVATGFTFSPASLTAARQGIAYDQALSITYPGSTAPVTWTVTAGALPSGITLASNGTLSGTATVNGSFSFTVKATDASGWYDTKSYSLTVNPPTTPDAPTIGTASAGNGQATVSWTAPASNGGAVITGYVVTPYLGAASQTPRTFASTDTSQTVTGLTNGSTYTFKVAATNSAGTGAQSSASNAVTPQADLPGVPTAVTATRGNAQASVSWTAPVSDGGSPITGYVVTPYIGSSAQTPQSFSSAATSQTVSGLTNGATYTFRVAATNAVGTGAESTDSNEVVPATTPGNPVVIAATAGDGQVDLSWSAPVVDGGSPITGYVITPYIGAVAQTPIETGDLETSRTITGLTNGTTYTFTVAAVNAVGAGTPSPASDPATPHAPATVPGAPTIGTATAGNGQATVTWTAPASDGGAAITGYVVTPSIGAAAQTPQSFASIATTQTITGLTNGTTYTFTVAAVNEVGTGADSAASNAVTPSAVSVPGAPAITSALPGNGQIALAWSAPSSNGGSAVTGYEITPYIGGVAQPVVNVTGTSKTITGLTNGTTFTFRVAAKNVAGTGDQSAESIAVTAGTPSAPGFQSAAPLNASAKVAWTAPANNGSAITGYVITPYVGSVAGTPQTFNTTATNDIVTGLTNGTEYTFKVAAINGNGTGAQATTAPITVGAPSQPVFPRAMPGTTSAQVIWNAASGNASPVKGYIVTPYIGSVAQTPVTFNSTSTTQTISGLTTGTTYSFRIAAFNNVGTGPTATTQQPVIVGTPAQPGFQVAGSGNGGAVVRYLIGAANAAPIQSFTVWPVQGSTVLSPQTFNTPSATVLNVTGLTNGTSYTFRIAATNSIGMGPYALTNAVIVGSPGSPGFPSAQPGDATAKVAWTIGPDNGSAITGYRVTPYIAKTAQPTQTFATTANNVTVTGLTNGTTYTFKVAAVNARGIGNEIETTAIKVGTPTTVSWPSAAPLDASAKVSWQAASSPASPLTGYVITPMIGTVAQPSQTFASTATTQTVTGLVNGTTYTFRIAGINAFGTGVYQTTAAVKVGLPSAPTGITAVAGPGQVTVGWTAPADNGSVITGYVITAYIGSTAQPAQTFDASTTSRVITGLTPGTAYTFKVAAINAIGTGAQSSASPARTPT